MSEDAPTPKDGIGIFTPEMLESALKAEREREAKDGLTPSRRQASDRREDVNVKTFGGFIDTQVIDFKRRPIKSIMAVLMAFGLAYAGADAYVDAKIEGRTEYLQEMSNGLQKAVDECQEAQRELLLREDE